MLPDSHGEEPKKTFLWLWQGEGKNKHYDIYILREFSIAKSSWGKGASLSLDSSRFPVSCKGEKEVVKNPSAGTQARYMTES